jgi:hypothetical protein
MAKQTINIGTSANDGTGSTLRAAFDICNDNFTELYDGTGGLLHKIEGTNFTGSLLVGHSTTGTLSSASFNTGVGIGALDALTTGDMNVALGYSAGSNINTGTENVALGSGAFQTATDSNRNIAIGRRALSVQNVSGNAYNVAIGHDAGRNVTTGLQNTIIGGLAGDALTTGSYNVALGYQALTLEDAHGKNTAIGFGALNSLNAGANGNNVALGYNAGASMDTGLRNTVIGTEAGDALTSGENNLLLGFGAAASAVDVSNEVTIGDSNISNVRIPSDSTLKIGVSGDLQLEHLSSNSFIKNTAVGDLYIENQVDDKDIIFRSDDGSGGLATYFYLDGSQATGGGTTFTKWGDNSYISLGDGSDLYFFHNGTDTKMQNQTGDLVFEQTANDKDMIFKCDDGSGGTTEYFRVDGGDVETVFSKRAKFIDNAKLNIGSSRDLEIFHDGTNTYIENYTGSFIFTQALDDGDMIFKSDDGSGGATEYFRLDGGNTRVQFNKDARFVDDIAVLFGSGGDSFIKHTGSQMSMFNDVGNIVITNRADDSDIIFSSDDGSGGTTEYFRVDGGDENVLFSKILKLSDNVELRIGGGNDIKIYHDTSNSYIKTGTEAGNLIIEQNTDDADIIFKSDDGSGGNATYFFLDGSETRVTFNKNLRLIDSALLELGTSGDLQIFHNSTDSFIDNHTGNLTFRNRQDDGDIVFTCDDGSGGLAEYFKLDGGLTLSVASKHIRFEDSVEARFGTGGDARIFHDASDTYFDNFTGDLYIRNSADDGDIIFKSDDGSGGTATYMTIDGGQEKTTFSKNTEHQDNVKGQFGDSGDLGIFHDGTNSKIENDTGQLRIIQNVDDSDMMLQCDDGSGSVTTYVLLDGSEVSTKILTQKVIMSNLPTSDPSNAGQLYTDSGVLKVSAG